jgi:hypothetical protein
MAARLTALRLGCRNNPASEQMFQPVQGPETTKNAGIAGTKSGLASHLPFKPASAATTG